MNYFHLVIAACVVGILCEDQAFDTGNGTTTEDPSSVNVTVPTTATEFTTLNDTDLTTSDANTTEFSTTTAEQTTSTASEISTGTETSTLTDIPTGDVTSEVPPTKPPCTPGQHFDGASFGGGIILALGISAIVYGGCIYYRKRAEVNYRQF